MDRAKIVDLALIAAWIFAIILVAALLVVAIVLDSATMAGVTLVIGVAWMIILIIVTSFVKSWRW